MDYIIETENLTKRYGTATVVDKVNLHVPKGRTSLLLLKRAKSMVCSAETEQAKPQQ